METKVYEYNNVKYRVTANKDIHSRLNSDDSFAATFFQQRTAKPSLFNNTQNEETSTPVPDHQEYTSESAVPKYKWTPEMTKLLIALYTERKDKFRDPKVRRKAMFTEIANIMKNEGYDVDFNDVDRKWRNMKSSFFTILSSNKGENTRWPYFAYLYPIFVNENDEVNLPYHTTQDSPVMMSDENGKSSSNLRQDFPSRSQTYRRPRVWERMSRRDQAFLKLKLIQRHKMNLLKLQLQHNKYLKIICEELKKANSESKKRNDLMHKFLNLYLSTCVFS